MSRWIRPVFAVAIGGCALCFAASSGAQLPATPPSAARGTFTPATFTPKVVVYKQVGGESLHLYIRSPKQTSSSQVPAIVFFHGGGWITGSPSGFDPQANFFTARGLVTIEVEYRLLQKGSTQSPEICVQDAKSAVRYVRAHAKELGIDSHRIVESGGSSGGYLAAFLSMVPGWDAPGDDLSISTRADALVLFNPVIDNSTNGYGNARFGETYKRYSPYFYVTKDTPPTLILSGSEDRLIHAPVLQQFKDAMEKAGVRCELILYPGQGHGFFNREPYRTQTVEAMDAFLVSLHYLPADAAVPAPSN